VQELAYRLHWALPGKGVRGEMILFNNEDMAPTGMTTMNLIDGDGGPTCKINDKSAPLEKALIKRATKRFG
jgi:hypothetical protein